MATLTAWTRGRSHFNESGCSEISSLCFYFGGLLLQLSEAGTCRVICPNLHSAVCLAGVNTLFYCLVFPVVTLIAAGFSPDHRPPSYKCDLRVWYSRATIPHKPYLGANTCAELAFQTTHDQVWINKDTKVICQGMTGRQGTFHTKQARCSQSASPLVWVSLFSRVLCCCILLELKRSRTCHSSCVDSHLVQATQG